MARGLGFADEDLDRGLASFSGGELTRASLARALASDPTCCCSTSRPTTSTSSRSSGSSRRSSALDAAVVLVAHDRWFLETVGTAVLELEGGRTRFFPGTWHAWRAEQAARELALGRAIERQQAEVARLERFVARWGAGTRARQAQSRAKALAKIERIERPPEDGAALASASTRPQRAGRVIFELEDARVEVGDPPVVLLEHAAAVARARRARLARRAERRRQDDADRDAHRPRPLAPAGCGSATTSQIGFLSQHAEEMGTDGSVLEATQRATGLTPNRARALLGRFLFGGELAEKPLAGSPAASAAACRWRSSSAAAPTS